MNQLIFLAFMTILCGGPAGASAERPNVVLIVADDLGYGDLSCYDGEGRIETPNCDQLAEEGCRFTQAYTAASVCTPARYSLLTGRYPWRTWLKKGVVGNTPALIEPGTFTIADLFKSAGYQTACIGKWHIGFGDRGQKDLDWNAEIPKGPCDDGFDYFFGMPVSHFYPPYVYIENRHVYNLDPSDPLSLEWPEGGGTPIQHGGEAATYKQEEAGRELADRACQYIEENSTNSFFLYYAAIEPHTPFTPHINYYGSSDAGLYGDFVVQFDDGVGRILQTLEQQGIASNTLVILTSDNGGIATNNGHLVSAGIEYNPNVPLRGDKGDFFEGGLRIPFLIRWPGVVSPGTVSEEVICQTDLMAAFADMLDEPIPAGAAEDSRNVLAALQGGAAPDEPFVLQSRAGFHALQKEEWIYLDGSTDGDDNGASLVDTPAQLYQLSQDLGQATNLYAYEPELVRALLIALNEIRGTPVPVSRDLVRLATYDFTTSPTPSKVDPDFVANGISVSDITESGDPDSGGSSPELTNFSGNSLNIKRNSLDADSSNFSDYVTFSIRVTETNHVLDLNELVIRFNQFSDDFSLTVYVDAGNGFSEAASLGGTNNITLSRTTRRLDLSSVAMSTSMVFRIEFAHANPGGAANTTLQLAEVGVNGWLIDPARPTQRLLAYEFKNTPTPSQVDPDFIASDVVSASDIAEFGDPDGNGSSPDLSNYTGTLLNIKRLSVDDLPDNFSDYATFMIQTLDGHAIIEADDLEFGFNQFADNFSLAVYADAGDGFRRIATLGGGANSNLASSTQLLDMRSVPAATALVFRIEFAHAQPDGAANTTLQLATVDLHGIVKTAVGFSEDIGIEVLDGGIRTVLSWDSGIGVSYRMESTTNLLSGIWEEGRIIPGDGGALSATNDIQDVQRFFRTRSVQ